MSDKIISRLKVWIFCGQKCLAKVALKEEFWQKKERIGEAERDYIKKKKRVKCQSTPAGRHSVNPAETHSVKLRAIKNHL